MDVALIALLTFVAAVIGTAAGFGISLLMIPVLAFFLPPDQVIFLVAIIHSAGSLWRVLLFRGVDWRLFWWFALPGLVASYAGARASDLLDAESMKRLLGGFLVAFAAAQLARRMPTLRRTNATAAVGGVAQGFAAGLFGIGGPVRSMALLAFGLPRSAYLATSGVIALVTDSTRIFTYAASGRGLPPWLWQGLLVFVPVALLGTWAARWLVRRVSQEKYERSIALFLLGVGALLVLAPTWAH